MKCFWPFLLVSVTVHLSFIIFIFVYRDFEKSPEQKSVKVAVTYRFDKPIPKKAQIDEPLRKNVKPITLAKKKVIAADVQKHHIPFSEEIGPRVGDEAEQSSGLKIDGSPSGIIVRRHPQLINEVSVPYPEKARQMMIEGVVRLRLIVSETGKVMHARILHGPAFGLQNAALEVAKKLRFLPATNEYGRVKAAEIDHEVVFSLSHVH